MEISKKKVAKKLISYIENNGRPLPEIYLKSKWYHAIEELKYLIDHEETMP